MIYKISRIFNQVTSSTNGSLMNKSQLDYLLNKLLERRIIIEHDLPLCRSYIVDFPCDFESFCNLVRQIFRIDLENTLSMKLNSYEEMANKIFKFLYFYNVDELNHNDLYEILQNLNFNLEEIRKNLFNLNKVDFLLKNIRDDLDQFLWNKLSDWKQIESQKTDLDIFTGDSYDYQKHFQTKIEYEYEIIRTRKVHFIDHNNNNTSLLQLVSKKSKKIYQLKAYCADRDIPIQTFIIPQVYFESKDLHNFFCKCEALRELLLSKHFPKFTGFDDLSDDDFSLYFFEYMNGLEIKKLIHDNELILNDSAILFRYLAKEILNSFNDLLHKSTHSFEFPISIDNIFYQVSHFRLYLNNIKFREKRVTILNSNSILEAKLLYSYGLILISLLSGCEGGNFNFNFNLNLNPEIKNENNLINFNPNQSSSKESKSSLKDLVGFIISISGSLDDLEQMQKIFDHIFEIEEILHKSLENEIVISIIIECLLTPYKAKLVFDDYYQKKNFLKEALGQGEDDKTHNYPQKKKTDILQTDEGKNDWTLLSYYNDQNNENESNNEDRRHKILTIRDLLTHPFYRELNLNESFLSFLFKKE
jgi:hypothetical protein